MTTNRVAENNRNLFFSHGARCQRPEIKQGHPTSEGLRGTPCVPPSCFCCLPVMVFSGFGLHHRNLSALDRGRLSSLCVSMFSLLGRTPVTGFRASVTPSYLEGHALSFCVGVNFGRQDSTQFGP